MPGRADRRPRVCIVTAGHLSTCPRMLKAADTLAEEGYDVRVVSTRTVDSADTWDHELVARRSWQWQPIDLRQRTATGVYLKSGVRLRASQMVARTVGLRTAPFSIAMRAYSRTHDELVAAIVSKPVEFIYGGTAGALAAVASAGRRLQVPFGLDLEDFHRGERDEPGAFENRLAKRIEDRVLNDAAFLTAGSGAIARAYAADVRLDPVPIHNTFPLPPAPPEIADTRGPVRLYWFSQGISGGRGLEDAIRAAGVLDVPMELHLRGRPVGGYLDDLQSLTASVAPKLAVHALERASPDAMAGLCRGHDIGLSPEQPSNINKDLCLGNKIFTYLLAGLPVVLTGTTAQRELAGDLGAAAVVYPPGDVKALAEALGPWTRDRAALSAAKGAAWSAARRRWHWEHPADRGTLVNLVGQVVGTAREPAARARR